MPYGSGAGMSPNYTHRPMGNAYDRRRQFLPDAAEPVNSGLYTTNMTGSQTAVNAGMAEAPAEASSPIIQNQNDAIRRARRVLQGTTNTLNQVYSIGGGIAARRAEFERRNSEDAQAQAQAMQVFQLGQARQNQQGQHNLLMDELGQKASAVLGHEGLVSGQAGAIPGSPLARLIAASNNKKANEDFAQSPGHSLGRLYGPNGGVEAPPEVGSGQGVMPNPDWAPGSSESKWITFGPRANLRTPDQMRSSVEQRLQQRDESDVVVDAEGNQLSPNDPGYGDGYLIHNSHLQKGGRRLQRILAAKGRRRDRLERKAGGQSSGSGLVTQSASTGSSPIQRRPGGPLPGSIKPQAPAGHTLPDGRPDFGTDQSIEEDREVMANDSQHQSQIQSMGIENPGDISELADALSNNRNRSHFSSSSVPDEVKFESAREYLRAFRAAYKESPQLAKNKLGYISGATMDEAMFLDIDDQEGVLDWVDKMLSDTSSEHRQQWSQNYQRQTRNVVPRLGY